jgi:hypothetical protein
VLARLLLACSIVLVASAVALVLRRRGRDVPTQPTHVVPTQLDRADFARPEAPWLVAVFSSATCQTCTSVVVAAMAAASDDVAVDDVEYGARCALHQKYAVDAVPCVVIADIAGVVRASFLGPVTAAALAAALADVRA